jgi:hypothetical protein
MLFEDFRTEHKPIEDDQEIDYPLDEESRSGGRFLGLTPGQRFIAVFLLSMMIVILGVLFLLATSKITLPFFR